MKKDMLKPYVYMVEGVENFVLFDMMKGNFYNFSLEGSVEELRKCLLEEELIFETKGIVPNKIMSINMRNVQSKLHIRELQIRLNGGGEETCWNRVINNAPKQYMKNGILSEIITACEYIPVAKIKIEAQDKDDDKIEQIIKGIKCNIIELKGENNVHGENLERFKSQCEERGIELALSKRKNLEKIKVEIFNFFYSKYYNPCLGHQVAIDTNGDIKPCLWFRERIGNISRDNLKDLIIAGKFDKYWEITKSKIETCKDCELRFNCDDCRVFTIKETGDLYSKSAHCNYDPYTG